MALAILTASAGVFSLALPTTISCGRGCGARAAGQFRFADGSGDRVLTGEIFSKMNSVVKLEHKDVNAIPFQEASLDIWDQKYRLTAKDGSPIDGSMDDTYKRVARALADVERTELREPWFEKFLWALRHGAIPAGRVISNAGALAHKPATSTINCTVSGTIRDSMNDILGKVHEAGLTLKAGCGIGYEFSTLRPRGAYVSGAGAYTSGPLSFMDIYDKMCFTVSSAGGRRGAQMGTFDVGHPDAMEFIRAKRENGRLRQFNLSLLVSDDFIEAVKADREWKLAFPLGRKAYEAEQPDLDDAAKFSWREWPTTQGYVTREDGLVCCKVYKTLPARRVWDVIMSSTYDFAEPGFVLIDRVNELNNNWWCENIRATNPCVTADTWVHTSAGPRQVAELVGTAFVARIDGRDHASGPQGFFKTADKPVVRIDTAEGQALRLTADHRVRRVTRMTRFSIETEWCAAGSLSPGDRVLLLNADAPSRANAMRLGYYYRYLRPQARQRVAVLKPEGSAVTVDVASRLLGKAVMNDVDVMSELDELIARGRDRAASVGDAVMVWKMAVFGQPESVDRMIEKARAYKTLVVDLRGNGGGSVTTLQELVSRCFDHEVVVAIERRRGGRSTREIATPAKNPFTGRLAVLVDSRSASAAEMFARIVQIEQRGIVLGDRTAGAVMRSRLFTHRVESMTSTAFYGTSVTVADVRMSDGGSLEKAGVEPDEVVLPTQTDLASGRDPLLARAIELAGGTITPEEAGKLFK